jgi:hypothetical protein
MRGIAREVTSSQIRASLVIRHRIMTWNVIAGLGRDGGVTVEGHS